MIALKKTTMEKDWFEDWFDSKYYHILYSNRDHQEAKAFVDTLLKALAPPAQARILDLACGKGRFSIHLADKGYDVVGLDLSTESIRLAQQFEAENLSFFEHDMRLPFRINYFDYVFNFFTSFGYFDTIKDHQNTLKNMSKNLKKGGLLVLDYFNTVKVLNQMQASQTKTIGGIDFHIKKDLAEGFIRKKINFEDEGRTYHFEERVRAFTLEDFEKLLAPTSLKLLKIYGDYQLKSFDSATSDRLILVAQKQ